MAVRKQRAKASLDAHELVKKAQALSTRPKHAKKKTGFKTKSDAYLNQVPILGDKGVIYTTPQSGGNYYFRTWIPEEKKYYRKSLRTNDLDQAIELGENEMLGILSKINTGHRVFGLSLRDMCEDWLQRQQDRVDTDRITKGRLDTLKTSIKFMREQGIGIKKIASELNVSVGTVYKAIEA